MMLLVWSWLLGGQLGVLERLHRWETIINDEYQLHETVEKGQLSKK